MKTVYLHIGTSKTGTSALQSFLLDNQEILREKGYCYETMPFSYLDRASKRRNAHFLLEKAGSEEEESVLKVHKSTGYALLGEWLEQKEHVILTDENLWNGMRGNAWEIFEEFLSFLQMHGAQIKIIVYLRRQDEYMLSWWKQTVRSGKVFMEWKDFQSVASSKMLLNYNKQLKKYAAYVGKENIIVRRYEKERFKGNGGTIFSDFLEAIGLEYTDEYEIKTEKVNESLSDNYAEIKRVAGKVLQQEEFCELEDTRIFEKAAMVCSSLSDHAVQKKYSMLSVEDQERIWTKYFKANDAVRRLYFPEDEVLFQNVPVEKEKWVKNNEEMIEDIITYFSELTLRQQMEHQRMEKQYEELKKEFEEQKRKFEAQSQKLAVIEEKQKASLNEYKQYKGELKALKILLAPVKYIWRLFHK